MKLKALKALLLDQAFIVVWGISFPDKPNLEEPGLQPAGSAFRLDPHDLLFFRMSENVKCIWVKEVPLAFTSVIPRLVTSL